MASWDPQKNDVSESFCHCPICLDYFREPAVLPCHHRFCRDCVNSFIQQSSDNHCCPKCRKTFSVPKGADGLKIDSSMESLINFIQLQKSLSNVHIGVCFVCSGKALMTAYCNECEEFLCTNCHEYHLKSSSFQNHQEQVIALKEAKSEDVNFVPLKRVSRCQTHSGTVSELCCLTCDKRQMCSTCTYGEHRNHNITKVKTLASSERKRLELELEDVTNAKENMYKMPPLLKKMKTNIMSDVSKRKENLEVNCEKERRFFRERIEELAAEYELNYQDMQHEKNKAIATLRIKKEEEVTKVVERYDQLIQEENAEFETKLQEFQNIHNKKLAKLNNTLSIVQEELKELVISIENEQKKRLLKIDSIVDHFQITIKRYESFQSIASSIVASRSDWTVVECVPAVCSAAKPLCQEMLTEFPELETLPEIDISNVPTIYVGEDKKGCITLSDKHVTVFETHKPDEWLTHDMATANGIVAISGCPSLQKHSSVRIVEKTNENPFECNIKSPRAWAWRYGDTLSESKVAAVSLPHTVGVYDLLDESHSKRNICDITESWPNERLVTCIATDEKKGHILVGGYNTGDIFVFNKQLEHCHTLTLPQRIYWPWDLIVNDNKLLVCDFTGKTVYALTMEESEVKVFCEFKKPDLDDDCMTPLNMCKDTNGFIYVLWKRGTSLQDGRRVLVRYSKVGQQLLTTEDINDNAACIETVETESGELLLVMTLTSGILFIYHLEGDRG